MLALPACQPDAIHEGSSYFMSSSISSLTSLSWMPLMLFSFRHFIICENRLVAAWMSNSAAWRNLANQLVSNCSFSISESAVCVLRACTISWVKSDWCSHSPCSCCSFVNESINLLWEVRNLENEFLEVILVIFNEGNVRECYEGESRWGCGCRSSEIRMLSLSESSIFGRDVFKFW